MSRKAKSQQTQPAAAGATTPPKRNNHNSPSTRQRASRQGKRDPGDTAIEPQGEERGRLAVPSMAMHGHLVIADISGYTRFLTESELEHANGIIAELLNAVISAIQAPLRVSSVEGDAVFMYGTMPEAMSGQTVLESVELLYCCFAGAVETMRLNTTCTCNACSNIGGLGLKIVMHCGEFATSEIAGRETLSGPDVILAHRLLKNHVREATGIDDYMLVTQACVDDLGVRDIVAGWVEHDEEYEHVGSVRGYVSSLPDIWDFVRSQNQDKVLQQDAWWSMSVYSQAPPAVVWDHLTDPLKRNAWMEATSHSTSDEVGGRIGVGTQYHCAHGEGAVTIFSVLDMRTVDYITFVIPLGDGVAFRYTDYVVPSGTGTRLVTFGAAPFLVDTGEPLPEGSREAFGQMLASFETSIRRLAEHAASAMSLS